MILLSSSSRRRRVTVAAIASVLATVAATGGSHAGAADTPPAPIEMIGERGLVGSDLDRGVERRGNETVASAGGFVYRDGRYGQLGVIRGAASIRDIPGSPGATVAQIHFGINNRGETVGHYIDTVGVDGVVPPGSYHGFVKDRRGHVITFDVPGAASLIVQGNNDHGQVVGAYVDVGAEPDPDGLLPPNSAHGFIRERDGRITTIDVPFPYVHNVSDINNRGQVVGYYDDPDRPYNLGGGFLRQPDGEIVNIDVPGALSTGPRCINDKGEVVGSYIDAGTEPNPDGTIPPGVIHGFIWNNGGYTTFDPAGSVYTLPTGCNDRGQITGGYQDAHGNEHGFVLTRGRTTTLDAPDRIDNIAWGINDRGDVVIPEPTVRLSFQVAAD